MAVRTDWAQGIAGAGVITVLFWNLDKKTRVLRHLACLAETHLVDVFLLAECPKNVRQQLALLNGLGLGVYREEAKQRAKVRAITRLATGEFVHRFTGLNREMAVWSLRAPKLTPAEVLLAGVHLPSKAGGNLDTDQLSVAAEVIAELDDIEDDRGHRNTAFIGDFNMHPYDPGMTSVTGVHGLMTKNLANLPDRVHRHRSRRRFYNPMWGFFGDRTPGPAGTYYWRSSVLHNPHGGILDQVLVRPALINHLDYLSILERDGRHLLTASDGAPNRLHLSDHLPVLFRLDI